MELCWLTSAEDLPLSSAKLIEINENCTQLKDWKFDHESWPTEVNGSFAIDLNGDRIRPWIRMSAFGAVLCYTNPLQCWNYLQKKNFFLNRGSIAGFSTCFRNCLSLRRLIAAATYDKTVNLSESILIWLSCMAGLVSLKKNGSVSINQQLSSVG